MMMNESETYHDKYVKARLTRTSEGYLYRVDPWGGGETKEQGNWGLNEREALIKWKALIKKYVSKLKESEKCGGKSL